eukprot:Hpha_TRINITY_DN15629_c3_g4::TRINITY_DN15629_c3_g4_i1::g.99620::m.99620
MPRVNRKSPFFNANTTTSIIPDIKGKTRDEEGVNKVPPTRPPPIFVTAVLRKVARPPPPSTFFLSPFVFSNHPSLPVAVQSSQSSAPKKKGGRQVTSDAGRTAFSSLFHFSQRATPSFHRATPSPPEFFFLKRA